MDEKRALSVLCYGDSNTYGYNPENGMRYPKNVRWTGILQELLGEEYEVLEEGCNGRTTVFEDPLEGWKKGIDYIKPCLNTHKPVDIVVMMLGSNDLKKTFHASAQEIADGAKQIVLVIKEFCKEKQGFVPQILLVAPPVIGNDICEGNFRYSFDETSITRSNEFGILYEKVAKECGCLFLNAGTVVELSPVDSLHLSAKAHEKLGNAIGKIINSNFFEKRC